MEMKRAKDNVWVWDLNKIAIAVSVKKTVNGARFDYWSWEEVQWLNLKWPIRHQAKTKNEQLQFREQLGLDIDTQDKTEQNPSRRRQKRPLQTWDEPVATDGSGLLL